MVRSPTQPPSPEVLHANQVSRRRARRPLGPRPRPAVDRVRRRVEDAVVRLTFTDISKSAGIDTSLGACVVSFTDFDRDGRQDIMVGVCNDVFFRPTPFELFRNLGNLKFADVAEGRAAKA